MEFEGGRQPQQDSAFSSRHRHPPLQEQPGSGLTTSAPVSDVSAPACTSGEWPPLRPVSVAQNKPSTMLSSNVQSIDLPMDCMAWRFWTMRQLNGCSTSAPRSSAAKQWFEQLAQEKKVQKYVCYTTLIEFNMHLQSKLHTLDMLYITIS